MALTTPVKAFFSSASAICAAMSRATLTCASDVEAPRCGVQMTFGCASSAADEAGGGSALKTSSAAPATLPSLSATSRSASFTTPPRATLTMRTPRLHLASVAAQMRLVVSAVLGTCIVMKSALAKSSSSETGRMPALVAASAERIGS